MRALVNSSSSPPPPLPSSPPPPSSHPHPPSSIGTAARCGLWPVEQYLCSTSVTINFLLCGVVSPTPNPQPGGPGYPF